MSFPSEEFTWKDEAVDCFPLQRITVRTSENIIIGQCHSKSLHHDRADLMDTWVVPASYPFLFTVYTFWQPSQTRRLCSIQELRQVSHP